MQLPERIDLHCHSRCSDGTLAPGAVAELAATRGVRLLSLTDHDTTAGCAEAREVAGRHDMAFLPGVELTCRWGGAESHEIHIVGLAIDPQFPALRDYCMAAQRLRHQRLERMLQQLERLGLPATALGEEAQRVSSPTRTHVARALLARGWAGSVQEAFERYLQRGRPGWVEASWPELPAAVQAIVASGGQAVLAHPHRYRFSGTDLAALLGQFRAAGGQGLEVSMAGMSPADTAQAARLARRFDLAGSVGSDFHEPGLPWRPLGRFAKLPDAVRPITASLAGPGTPRDDAIRQSGR